VGSFSLAFSVKEWEPPDPLFQGRKRLSYNGLIVVEEAASQRHQSHREDRQDGDHTHYKTPFTQNYGCQKSTFRAPGGGEIATASRKATQSNRGPARLGFAFGGELLDVVV
jgi:hypothetical protein